jgi:hypothetical protein
VEGGQAEKGLVMQRGSEGSSDASETVVSFVSEPIPTTPTPCADAEA